MAPVLALGPENYCKYPFPSTHASGYIERTIFGAKWI
jgi:hypothetical protein